MLLTSAISSFRTSFSSPDLAGDFTGLDVEHCAESARYRRLADTKADRNRAPAVINLYRGSVTPPVYRAAPIGIRAERHEVPRTIARTVLRNLVG